MNIPVHFGNINLGLPNQGKDLKNIFNCQLGVKNHRVKQLIRKLAL
jgi:hypothetical protein